MAQFKTRLRLNQMTGSFGDFDGGIIDTRAAGSSTLASIGILSGSMVGVISEMASAVKRIHGAGSFAAAAPGTFHHDLVPNADDSLDLGSASAAWQDLHLEGDVLMTDAGKVSTAAGDLELESAAGSVNINAAEAAADAIVLHAENANGGIDLSVNSNVVVSVDSNSVDIAQGTVIAHAAGLSLGAGGNEFSITESSDDVTLASLVSDKDMIFKVNDGGAATEVMRLDGDVAALKMASGKQVQLGGAGANLSGDGSDISAIAANNFVIDAQGTDAGDGVSITLGSDTADTKLQVKNNSGVLKFQADATGDGSFARDLGIGRDLTVTRNVVINGDLDVNGATTTIDTANMAIEDSIIGIGTSGSLGYAPAAMARGIVFGAGALSAHQAALYHGGSGDDRFHLGVSATSPLSSSFATPSSYSKLRLGRVEIENANNRIFLDTDLKLASAADIVLSPVGGEVKADGNVIPSSDSAKDLGADGVAWRKLYADDIDLNGVGRIDLDADADTSIRSPSDDTIAFEAGGADVFFVATAGAKLSDDKGLVFGTNDDASFKYDEAGSDTLLYTGASLRISDDTKLEFGAAGDASIEYDEDGTDQLRFALPAAGMVLGGTAPKLVIGDAGAEDTLLVFDGNAQDYRIGLDDGTDKLEIGLGAAHGSTIALTVDASQIVDLPGHTGGSSDGLSLGGTVITATGAELNIMDGHTSATSTTLVDADRVVVNDAGTMKQVSMLDMIAYMQSFITQKANIDITATLAANADFDTGLGADYTDGNSKQREVYVNGQLMSEGADAAANKDFYPGGSAGRIKFEFALEAGDVVQVVLRRGDVS